MTEKIGRVRTCRMASGSLDALEQWVRDHRTKWEGGWIDWERYWKRGRSGNKPGRLRSDNAEEISILRRQCGLPEWQS